MQMPAFRASRGCSKLVGLLVERELAEGEPNRTRDRIAQR
jgi:hypothetical protein